MIRFVFLLLAMTFTAPALAQTCPGQPPVSDKHLQAQLRLSARSAARLAEGTIAVAVNKEQKEIFSKYPNADRLTVNMVLLSMFCQELRKDRSLSSSKKIDRMMEFRKSLL